MKKILSIFLAASISVVFGVAGFSVSASSYTLPANLQKESLADNPLSLITSEAGTVQTVTGGVRLLGRNADDTADAYVNTWQMLGKGVSDFVWEFDYTPARAAWNMDKFAFRCTGEGENDCYVLRVQGASFGAGAGLQLSRGNQYDAPYASYAVSIAQNTTYHVRIVTIGKDVKVWFYDKSGTEPDSPAISVTLPDTAGDAYLSSGDFQFFSWAGDYTLSNMTIDKLVEASPFVIPSTFDQTFVSNPLSLISSEAGTVNTVTGGVRLVGRTADDTADAYVNTWKMLQQDVSDFVWEFDYTPARAVWNTDKFAFRCGDDNENEWNGYVLRVQGTGFAAGAGIQLSKGEDYGNPYASVPMSITANTTYHVKIAAIGKDVKVWFYDKSQTAPVAPMISVTLPEDTEKTAPYTNQYLASGDFQFFSWAGDYTLSNMSIDKLTQKTTSSTKTGTTVKDTTTTDKDTTTTSGNSVAPATGDTQNGTVAIGIAVLSMLAFAAALTRKKMQG